MARTEAYLHAKFYLDPSKRLATIQQRHRQTDRTGQRSDSIGRRAVLQTCAQKLEYVAPAEQWSYVRPQVMAFLVSSFFVYFQLQQLAAD